MKYKTRLWQALEYHVKHEIPLSKCRDFPGPTVKGVILQKDKNKVGRQDKKAIACACDGANAICRITGAKAAAVGGSRFLTLMPNGTVQIGEFYGPEVHLRHDALRSAKGCEFALRAPRRYENVYNPNPKPVRPRGKRYFSRREQILAAAFQK